MHKISCYNRAKVDISETENQQKQKRNLLHRVTSE